LTKFQFINKTYKPNIRTNPEYNFRASQKSLQRNFFDILKKTERISIGESKDELQRQVESIILRKFSMDRLQMICSTTEEELKRAMTEVAKYPVFKDALNSLIVRNLVSRIGTNEYLITGKGILEQLRRDL
jgi:hypothetical protein